MSKIQEILSGWTNLVFKNEDVEKIAKERLEICSECEFMSEYPNEMKSFSTCTSCGCVLSAKCRSEKSICPKDKWKIYESGT